MAKYFCPIKPLVWLLIQQPFYYKRSAFFFWPQTMSLCGIQGSSAVILNAWCVPRYSPLCCSEAWLSLPEEKLSVKLSVSCMLALLPPIVTRAPDCVSFAFVLLPVLFIYCSKHGLMKAAADAGASFHHCTVWLQRRSLRRTHVRVWSWRCWRCWAGHTLWTNNHQQRIKPKSKTSIDTF